MNRLILRLLACVAVTQVGTAVAAQNTSVAPDEEAWQQAISANSLEAYAKFSMDFPDSRHIHHARAKLAGTTIVPGQTLSPSRGGGAAKSDTMEFVPNQMMVV